MQSTQRPPSTRRWKIAAIIGGVALASVAVIAQVALVRAEPRAHQKIVTWLEAKFDSSVELAELHLRILPYPQVIGKELALRWKHRTDIPPMIRIKEFGARLAWFDLIQPNWHINRVVVKQFDLNIPPRSREPKSADEEAAEKKDAEGDDRRASSIVVDEVVADQTTLRMIPREASKEPKEFELYRLRIWNAGAGRPMQYETEMKNHKPPGLIRSTGEFGPWMGADPGMSPLQGGYTFSNADLGVFKGIAGVLSSKGSFEGILSRINIQGITETPDFRLRMVGNPIPLTTKFQAVVDGTNGTTVLQPVDAVLGKTTMRVEGGVFAEKGVKGKDIELNAAIRDGRFEDLLQLAVKGGTPMTGSITLDSLIRIPRGDVDVIEKLGLQGKVEVLRMRFTDADIQGKIDELSRRGQGQPEAEEIRRVPSRLTTQFTLKDAVIDLPVIRYAMEGAQAEARGQFAMKSQEIDFQGILRLEAKPSETVTGLKSWLMKPLDSLLSRQGRGTVLSFKVSGTRTNPSFGLDWGRTFKKTDD